MIPRAFTREELSSYDGQNGTPGFVAYEGRVYDVSRSYYWRRGRHWARHRAGRDLTAELREAPHGAEMLGRYPVVGTLAGDEG